MVWENGIETCILSYVKRVTCPGLMHDTGCSGLVHSEDLEGWDGKGGGRGFRMGNTCTPMVDSCQCMAKPIQYCKVINLQIKIKINNQNGLEWGTLIQMTIVSTTVGKNPLEEME